MDDPIDWKPIFGPALCHACHFRLYYFKDLGWLEKETVGIVMEVPVYRYVYHRCTALMTNFPDAPPMRPR